MQKTVKSDQSKGETITISSSIKNIEYTIEGGIANVLTDRIIALPETYAVDYYSNKNCSDNRRGWTQNITLKVAQGQSYKISNSVTTKKSTSYSLSFKIPIPNIKGELAGATTTTVEFATSNSQEVQRSITTEETVAKTISFDVDPKKALYIKFQTIKYSLKVPFEATLFVNGYVIVESTYELAELGIHIGPPTVIEERIPIESLLSIQDRTFNITGFLENSKAGKETIEYAEQLLTSEECNIIANTPTNNIEKVYQKFQENKQLSKSDIKLFKSINTKKAIDGLRFQSGLGDGTIETQASIVQKQLSFKKIDK
ncbi:hypothetical protein ACE38W_13600 [Chitinophaga sp. Hz27]|uniref:hypothetical protein n=1 Tax=Chitinophaga sp. Hz27 TaxID=3347169 RepID=UPI0035D936F4